MNYVVAVSGGIDSVVLLDMLVNSSLPGQGLQRTDKLVVAHFDHGIRDTSDADARFVEALAAKYGLTYEQQRVELGKNTSEAEARAVRYTFLRAIAKKHKAMIMTAHHQDDLVETIAINLQRGTGWRGLAVLGGSKILRPLLGYRKSQLYEYALKNNLEWVEDETNDTDAYLRNRLRRKLNAKLDDKGRKQLVQYWKKQLQLRAEIEAEDKEILTTGGSFSRYFFTHIDEDVAGELLRSALEFAITRPQTHRLIHGIKTAKAGSVMEIGAGRTVRFTLRDFVVETP